MTQLIDRRARATMARKAKIFAGFAESSRLRIVDALRGGEKTVSQICQTTKLTQPNASNHLACLLGCRIVEREQRGRQVFYRLADERIEALLLLAEEIASGMSSDGACCPVCGSEP
jgi:DNA-binding transcriptional ArsR family regulator